MSVFIQENFENIPDIICRTIEVEKFNDVCKSIYDYNLENYQESILQCISYIQHENIILFYVIYGAQKGNSWFSYRDIDMMKSIGGNWEAPFLMIFRGFEFLKIYHLPDEIGDLKVHKLEGKDFYFSGRIKFFEETWFLDSNGEKIDEPHYIIDNEKQEVVQPKFIKKLWNKGYSLIQKIPIPIKWK